MITKEQIEEYQRNTTALGLMSKEKYNAILSDKIQGLKNE